MTAPLLPAGRRWVAGLLAAGCAVVLLWLGLAVAGEHTATRADHAAAELVHSAFAGRRWVLAVLAWTTHPLVVTASAAAVAWLGLRRLGRPAAVLAAGAPLLAVAVNTWVLKPAFGREHGDHLAYPSGHLTGLAAVLAVLVLLTGRLAAAAGVLLLALATVPLIGLGYHYLTDAVGAGCWAVVAVVGSAASLDGTSRFRERRGAANP